MILNIDNEMKLSLVSRKAEEGNKLKILMSQRIKSSPIVIRIESITMIDYVPVIKGVCIIPEKFDICSTVELSAVINKEGVHIKTNTINVNMKGGN